MTDSPAEPAEVAYHYPEPMWYRREGDWIKSLLLFFDEIALLLPRYMRERPYRDDSEIAGPLEHLGLLKILQPELFIDAPR